MLGKFLSTFLVCEYKCQPTSGGGDGGELAKITRPQVWEWQEMETVIRCVCVCRAIDDRGESVRLGTGKADWHTFHGFEVWTNWIRPKGVRESDDRGEGNEIRHSTRKGKRNSVCVLVIIKSMCVPMHDLATGKVIIMAFNPWSGWWWTTFPMSGYGYHTGDHHRTMQIGTAANKNVIEFHRRWSQVVIKPVVCDHQT